MAEYISRLGNRLLAIEQATAALRGKMAGAVGAYNAISLFFDDPECLEREVLAELGLIPSTHSTQIVEPEYVVDWAHALVSTLGVLANIGDDLRHLQRSEIAEVGEFFEESQVGSSTMPHSATLGTSNMLEHVEGFPTAHDDPLYGPDIGAPA